MLGKILHWKKHRVCSASTIGNLEKDMGFAKFSELRFIFVDWKVTFILTRRFPDFFMALLGFEMKREVNAENNGFNHEYITRRLLWEELRV
jgi:hypothetical protein